MATKHTPGPWLIDYIDGDDASILIKAGEHVSYGYKVAYHIAENIGGRTPNGDRREVLANARLIAAAPELLEALILLEAEMVASGNASSVDYGWRPAIEKTRAAIAKATGETA